MTFPHGPNSKGQGELRRVVLRLAPKLLKEKDAAWLHKAAGRPSFLRAHYVIAAAQLDRTMAPQWLKEAIRTERDQEYRCSLLLTLWSVSGDKELRYVVETYYRDGEPSYNAGGLQEDFVKRLGNTHGKKAAGVLKALVLDPRFRALCWPATRAYARHAGLLVSGKTPEVKRYLRVNHRMGPHDFEQRPERRGEYPVDTKHVLMQTEAFQKFFQAEVRKSQGGPR
jgi:hypothetical protein